MTQNPEEWRDIPGWEGLYQVSSEGRLRRLNQRYYKKCLPLAEPVEVTSKRVGKGYRAVQLARGGVKIPFYVHELVLLAFSGPKPTEDHEGAHLNGIRHENRRDNLAWKARAENHADKRLHGTMPVGERHTNAKLTDLQAAEIRARGHERHSQLAKEYGVSRSLISQICRGAARAYS